MTTGSNVASGNAPNGAPHKEQLQSYFDGIGFERWAAIYGEQEKLSFIRRTVREGHRQMMAQAEAWLLESLQGGTLLDAGCGTGLFSVAMARHGFDVTAVDIAPRMLEAARKTAALESVQDDITFIQGDTETVDGTFDAVACFDVLVHYPRENFARLASTLAARTRGPLLFTYAPYNPIFAFMHWLGGHFPSGNRRTEIQMIPDEVVEAILAAGGMRVRRATSISVGFYHVKLLEAAPVE